MIFRLTSRTYLRPPARPAARAATAARWDPLNSLRIRIHLPVWDPDPFISLGIRIHLPVWDPDPFISLGIRIHLPVWDPDPFISLGIRIIYQGEHQGGSILELEQSQSIFYQISTNKSCFIKNKDESSIGAVWKK